MLTNYKKHKQWKAFYPVHVQEKSIVQLFFNPGLALTGFQPTWPSLFFKSLFNIDIITFYFVLIHYNTRKKLQFKIDWFNNLEQEAIIILK